MLPRFRSEPESAVGILEAYAVNYIREAIQLEANLIQKAFGVYCGDRELLDGAIRVLPVVQLVKALQREEVIG